MSTDAVDVCLAENSLIVTPAVVSRRFRVHFTVVYLRLTLTAHRRTRVCPPNHSRLSLDPPVSLF